MHELTKHDINYLFAQFYRFKITRNRYSKANLKLMRENNIYEIVKLYPYVKLNEKVEKILDKYAYDLKGEIDGWNFDYSTDLDAINFYINQSLKGESK